MCDDRWFEENREQGHEEARSSRRRLLKLPLTLTIASTSRQDEGMNGPWAPTSDEHVYDPHIIQRHKSENLYLS